jgi:hypothetical protein
MDDAPETSKKNLSFVLILLTLSNIMKRELMNVEKKGSKKGEIAMMKALISFPFIINIKLNVANNCEKCFRQNTFYVRIMQMCINMRESENVKPPTIWFIKKNFQKFFFSSGKLFLVCEVQ